MSTNILPQIAAMDQGRKERGWEMFLRAVEGEGIISSNGAPHQFYVFASQPGDRYLVATPAAARGARCTCRDHQRRGEFCKHLLAATLYDLLTDPDANAVTYVQLYNHFAHGDPLPEPEPLDLDAVASFQDRWGGRFGVEIWYPDGRHATRPDLDYHLLAEEAQARGWQEFNGRYSNPAYL